MLLQTGKWDTTDPSRLSVLTEQHGSQSNEQARSQPLLLLSQRRLGEAPARTARAWNSRPAAARRPLEHQLARPSQSEPEQVPSLGRLNVKILTSRSSGLSEPELAQSVSDCHGAIHGEPDQALGPASGSHYPSGRTGPDPSGWPGKLMPWLPSGWVTVSIIVAPLVPPAGQSILSPTVSSKRSNICPVYACFPCFA